MERRLTDPSRAWMRNMSPKRIGGFALDRVWVAMLFYSIVPYLSSSDVRGSLYMNLFVSLAATTVTLLFVSIVVQRRDRVGTNRFMVGGAAALMSAGSVLVMFADTNTAEGMLVLGIAGIATGIGSAVVFLGWMELFSELGARHALVEIAIGSCAAFVAALFLTIVPSPVAMVVIIALPPISSAMLCALMRKQAESLATEEPKRAPLSRQTVTLFVKALCGAFLLGMLEGFFDVLSGFRTYAVQDVYGIYLIVGGLAATLVIVLIAVFRHRDSLFSAYRFALMLFCVGCLVVPFMGDNNTYCSALIFGGYNGFLIILCVVCIDVSSSFRVGPTRAVGVGFLVLNAGEIVGSLGAHGLDVPGLPSPDLLGITLIAVTLLFVSHLFLFTETDLVRLGIGEEYRVLPGATKADAVAVDAAATDASESAGEGKGDVPVADPSGFIVECYGLSPRESDVLPLLLQGRTISRIQEALFISAGTVSTHIRHIYQKTGVNNRQELLDLAQGLVDSVGEDA